METRINLGEICSSEVSTPVCASCAGGGDHRKNRRRVESTGVWGDHCFTISPKEDGIILQYGATLKA